MNWWLERRVRNEIVIKGVVLFDNEVLVCNQGSKAKDFWYLCLV